MHFLNGLYTLYVVIVFLLTCLIVVPTLAMLSHWKSLHLTALRLHWWWAQSFFILVGLPVRIDWRFKPKQDGQYIFCANHFSFLDIATMCLVHPVKFIGKSSLEQVPVFGYFYRKLHITVTRESVRSRAMSLSKSREAVDEGFSLAFFPEGGIWVKPEDIPAMMPFRDGAFKLSVETRVPIVPVTLVTNYRILPDQSPLRFFHHPCCMVVHPPVYPIAGDNKEIQRLKEEVHSVIQEELNRHEKVITSK